MHILVATDLSNRSERARKLEGRLTVVHVVNEDLPEHLTSQLSVGARDIISTTLQEIPHRRCRSYRSRDRKGRELAGNRE